MFHAQNEQTRARQAAYATLLEDLLILVGAELPVAEERPEGRRISWHLARRAVGRAVEARAEAGPLPDEWFEPLIRAAVHEGSPSFVRDLIAPAVDGFGRRRVRLALLAYLEGTVPDAAGAARSWYATLVPVGYKPGTNEPTPESAAELEEVKDLDQRYADSTLRRFVADDDLGLRQALLPCLTLSPERYAKDLRPLVAEAIRIARTSDDEYLRRRIEDR